MLDAVRIWILLSSLLVASGWVLSAFHELNRTGYAVIFALAAAAFFLWKRKSGWHPRKNLAQRLKKFRRRFRRPAPGLFLGLAVMTFLAGALYPSQNNDSNEYRIPRVWHWLAEGRWHWIHTLDFRMNVAGCNFEWLAAPLMLFTRYDRCIFLANWVSFLLLPGLIFSVFTRLQVRARVAWWWMWLLSSGLCYVLQARSDVNDSFAVIYALASVDFALRAREKNRVSDLCFSILSVGLLTGAKQTDLPLALPWLVAILPCWRLAKSNARAIAGICVPALLISALPITYFNLAHTGTWMGFPKTSPIWKVESPPAIWSLMGNAFCLPLENLLPPYFPFMNQWNHAMEHFVQTPRGSHFREFESFGQVGQAASETNAGIGLWIFLFTFFSAAAAKMRGGAGRRLPNNHLKWVRWAPYASVLIFMAKVATFANARQMAPYYVFLFPAILVAKGQAGLVRKKWWQWSGVTVMVLTAAMLIVMRDRPLFPAKTILVSLKEKHPRWHFLAKAWNSYACRFSVLGQRNAFRDTIPPGEHVLGYGTVRGSQEPGQWLPFGSRRVERVLPNDSPQDVRAKGIHYVLLDSTGLGMLPMTIAEWTNRFDGVLIGTLQFETMPGDYAQDYLVRLNTLQDKKTTGADRSGPVPPH